MTLFDVAPIAASSPVGIGVAIVFFLVFAVIAFIAFKMIKRTVKMAIRMVIVGIILLIAIIGSIALLLFTNQSSSGDKGRPPASRPR
jgi:dolichyl-phosphate-mannose--protein O-mannosyl transferase